VSTKAIEATLIELLALERERTELEYVGRSDALERVGDAVRRLGEVGSPAGILARAGEELARSSRLERVLISELVDGRLHPRALWTGESRAPADQLLARLREVPIALEYPLIDHEVAARQQARLVDVGRAGPRAAGRLLEVLGFQQYVVAALVVQRTTVGLLHADAGESARALDPLDVELTARFSEGLAGAFERAALRDTLRLHRQELQSAVQWISGHLGQLAVEAGERGPAPGGAGEIAPGVAEVLTRRELEVLGLLARGQTNAGIASLLMVREGTVKFHVKNVLRKLGARSRADAVSRYVRATEGVGTAR